MKFSRISRLASFVFRDSSVDSGASSCLMSLSSALSASYDVSHDFIPLNLEGVKYMQLVNLDLFYLVSILPLLNTSYCVTGSIGYAIGKNGLVKSGYCKIDLEHNKSRNCENA